MLFSPQFLIHAILQLFQILIIAYVVVSWIPSLRRHPVGIWVERTVDPGMRPLRRLIPQSGGLDFSPLLALILLQLVARLF
jgi:YggT family protein